MPLKSGPGVYGRLKRAFRKPAFLTAGRKENAALMRQAGSAGSNIYNTLYPYLADLDRQRLLSKMIKLLRGGLKKNRHLDLSVLRGLDMQKNYPLRRLLRSGFQWQHDRNNHIFRFRIDIPEHGGALLQKGRPVSHYRFIILLLYGHPEKEGTFWMETAVSPDYPFAGTGTHEECLMEIPYTPVPAGQWLFCVRAECLVEGKPALHAGTRALRMLDGGRWE